MEWPVRIPDHTPLDFYLWGGHVKALVYSEKLSPAQLWEPNVDAGNTVAPGTIRHVTADCVIPDHLWSKQNGGLIQHISKYKPFNYFSLRTETLDTLYILSLSCKW